MATWGQWFSRLRYFGGTGRKFTVDYRLTIDELVGNGDIARRGTTNCLLPDNLMEADFSSLTQVGRDDGTVVPLLAFVDHRRGRLLSRSLVMTRCGLWEANAADLFACATQHPSLVTYQRWHLTALGELGLLPAQGRGVLGVETVVACVRPSVTNHLKVELRNPHYPSDPTNNDVAFLLVGQQ